MCVRARACVCECNGLRDKHVFVQSPAIFFAIQICLSAAVTSLERRFAITADIAAERVSISLLPAIAVSDKTNKTHELEIDDKNR